MLFDVDDDGKERYTETTRELTKEVQDALKPILEKYIALGYKYHEIEYIMFHEAMLVSVLHRHNV